MKSTCTTFKFLLAACLLLASGTSLSALDYYWVNGSGEWGESVTVPLGGGGSITHMAHWAKIPVPLVPQDYHTVVPGPDDDVKFDGHNGDPVTIGNNTIAKCHNFNCSGAASAFSFSGGAAERLEIYGNTVLLAGMTIQIEVRFEAIMGGGGSITSSGVHFGNNVYFEGDGSAGGWVLNDALGVGGTIWHNAGHLLTNGNSVTVGNGFYGDYYGGNSAELTLGASTVTINGDHGFFYYLPANFEAGTSNIISNSGGWIHGHYQTPQPTDFYNVTYNVNANNGFAVGNILGTLTFHEYGKMYSTFSFGLVPLLNNVIFEKDGYIYNANDYHNLTLTAGHSYTFSHQYNIGYNGIEQTITPGGNITIAGGGGGCAAFMTMKTWKYGDPTGFINNSGANITLDNLILQDIHATPANSMIANNSLDLGNNTGWSFTNTPLPGQRYWVGGDGDWNEQSHWSTTSGGAPGACIPTPNDDVFFDQNSGFVNDGGGVTITDAAFCKSMDWSAVTGMPVFQGSGEDIYIYGSLTWAPPGAMTLSIYTPTYHFRGVADVPANVVTSAGQTWPSNYLIFEAKGTYELGDALNAPASYISHYDGKLRTMGHDVFLWTWYGNFDPFNNIVLQSDAEAWLGDPIGGGGSSVITLGFYPNSNNYAFLFLAEYASGKFHAMNSEVKVETYGQVGSWHTAGLSHDFWKVTFENLNPAGYGAIESVNILDKVSFSGEGEAYIDAQNVPSVTIHEAEILVETERIQGNNIFETLTLAGGHGHRFNAGNTQTITATGSLNIVNADCEGMAYLYTSNPTETAFIKKDGAGALNLDRVILDNIYPDPTPGPTYSATNSVALQPAVGTAWNLTNPASRNLYWVGGPGNWNESAHWSLASGGSGGECPPTPVDNVKFNGSSGLGNADVATIGQPWAFCRDMDWTGGSGILDNGLAPVNWTNVTQQLQVFGNLKFSSTMVNDFDGLVRMRTHDGLPTSITSAGNHFKGNLHFWDLDGDYSLNDPLFVDITCQHEYGKLHTNDQDITLRVGWYQTSGHPSAELSLGNSTMTILADHPNTGFGYGHFYYGPGKFHSGTSSIIFNDYYQGRLFSHTTNTQTFYNVTFKAPDSYMWGGDIAHKLIFEKTGHLRYVYPNNYIQEAEFWDDFTFYDSRNFHSLKLFPGRFYWMDGNTTQTIVPDVHTAVEGEFIAQGLPGQFINIKSLDLNNPATIHMDDIDGDNICTHYLFLTAMEHTGTEVIYVPTPNANIFNNTGWQFFPCNPCPATIPVLDVAASITTGCPPGQAKLVLAGLKPDEWAIWYTDPAATTNMVYNGGTPGPAGNMFMPVITGPITYYARVYSDGGLCESTVVLAVHITVIDPPLIFDVFGGGNLCTYSAFVVGVDSSQIGVDYQLLFNGSPSGSPVAGTGDTIIFPYQGVPGTYSVLATVHGTACSILMNGSVTPTYSALPAPLLSMGGPGPVCVGSTITVYENFGDAVSWLWTGPAGFTSTAQYPPFIPNVTLANAGRYSVEVTGANGCTSIGSLDVDVVSPFVATLNVTPISCNGANDGSIEVLVNGGAAPFTYDWIIGGQTTALIDNLSAGFYVVQVFDTYQACESTLSTTLVDPQVIVTCPSDQTIGLSAAAFALTGGMPVGGTYSGSGVNNGFFDPGSAGLGAHPVTYSYTDGNGCTGTCSFTMNVLDIPVITCPGDVVVNLDPGACNDFVHYTIPVVTGGVGGVGVLQTSGLTSGAAFPIGITVNCFEATDAQNNTATCCFTVTVNEYPFPIASLFCNDLVYISLAPPACQFTIGAEHILDGGPYHCYNDYLVEMDNMPPLGNGPWVPAVVGVADIGNTYQIQVTDPDTGNKCWGNVHVQDVLPPQMQCSDIAVDCGPPPEVPPVVTDCQSYTLTWTDQVVQNTPPTIPFQVITREWTATDAGGLTSVCTQTITIQYPQPAVQNTCTATACEGTFGGGLASFDLTDEEPCITQGAAGVTVRYFTDATLLNEIFNTTAFVSGTTTVYTLVANMSSGCTSSGTLALTVTPLPDAGYISGNSSICANEASIFTTTGLSGGFWGSSDFSVATVDANTGVVQGVAPGNCNILYFVTANGCSNTVDFPLEVRPLPVVLAVSNSPVCAGGDLILDEIGGEALDWNWLGSNGFYVPGIQNLIIPNAMPSMDGVYTVAGLGPNGCWAYSNVLVTVTGPASAGTISGSATVCQGKNTPLSIIGTPGGTWSSSNNAIATVNPMTGLVQGVAPGMVVITYTVSVNGCTETADFNIEVKPRPAVAISGVRGVCENETLILTETGGDAVSWVWSNGLGFVTTDQTLTFFNPLYAVFGGFANVSVTDANGCTNSLTVDAGAQPLPAVLASSNAPLCAGAGPLELYETGGAQDVTWAWSGPGGYQSTAQNPVIPNPTPANSGDYTVVVTDDWMGCTNSAMVSVTVTAPEPVPVVANLPNIVSCSPAVIQAPSALNSCDPNGPVIYGTPSAPVPVDPNATPPAYIFGPGVYVVTWTYNLNGVIVTQPQLITIHAQPSVSCPPNSSTCLIAGPVVLSGGDPAGGDYSGPGVNAGVFDPTVAGLGQHSITYSYTDANSCTGSCTFSITVVAGQLPAITCPGPVTVPCAGNIPAPDPGLVVLSGGCGSATIDHLFTSLPYDVDCLNRFKVTRYYQATDASNNTVSCSQVITVFDDTKPNFTFVPPNVMVQCNSLPAVGSPAASDNCGGAVHVAYNGQTRADGICTDRYTLTRQWTATDGCGNTRTATQRITVIDTQKPAFVNPPANVTVQCSNLPPVAAPVATDNCDAAVAITYVGQTRTNGSCLNAYTLTRRWVASDNCTNTASISQRITVMDNGKPTLTLPPNTTIACNAAIPPVGTPSASDGCDGTVAIVYLGQTTANTTCPGNYQIRRSWRATDVCGNSTVATQTIQVADNQPPVFTSVPADATISCTQSPPPLNNPVATDNCGGYVQITYLGQVRTDGNGPDNYDLTRTWRATDACGNSVTAVQVIRVRDTEAPVFTNPPADLTVLCAANCVPGPTTPNAIDNCSTPAVTMQENQSAGDCSTGYTVTRIWTATDACGNVVMHTQTFTVLPASSFSPPAADRDEQLNTQNPKPSPAEASAKTGKTLNLLPNPTTDRVWIDLGDFAGERVQVSIHNDLGQLIWERRVEVVAGLKLPVSLREAGATVGLYTVSVRSGGQVVLKRLVLAE